MAKKQLYCIAKVSFIILLFMAAPLWGQSIVDSISVQQLVDGSGLVRICYRARNAYDTLVAVNTQAAWPESTNWNISMITILDTLSEYSTTPNYGWRVGASFEGVWHCFLWDMTTDIANVQQCGFRVRFALFDSILGAFELADSFYVRDSLHPEILPFGLSYRHGKLWVLFNSDATHECWIKSYIMPDMTPVDSFWIGTVTVGPSDMVIVGDRLFWVEDTRVLLKEFDFETGESHVVRGDWWGLPGTTNHIAGAAFDGQNLWVCFCEGTFIALDTSDFSLVDTMFFPDFGISVPATCADGLSWGLGLLWCFSNDNYVYAIDTEMKTIIHRIPTGAVAVATGAEGCAWDGVNLWVVDYGRGYIYKLSLFQNVRFTLSPPFCLDNTAPQIGWLSPKCPSLTDTLIAEDTVALTWWAVDSHLAGGTATIMLDEDTIATVSSTDTAYMWIVSPWPSWDGAFVLSLSDTFGNVAVDTSCEFYITFGDIDFVEKGKDDLFIYVYPNPFNSSCAVFAPEGATISVFDIDGRQIGPSRIVSKPNERLLWKPTKNLPAGVYFIRAEKSSRAETKRVIYLR